MPCMEICQQFVVVSWEKHRYMSVVVQVAEERKRRLLFSFHNGEYRIDVRLNGRTLAEVNHSYWNTLDRGLTIPQHGRDGKLYGVKLYPCSLLNLEVVTKISPLKISYRGITHTGQPNNGSNPALPRFPDPDTSPPWGAIIVLCGWFIRRFCGAIAGRKGFPWSGFTLLIGVLLWTYGIIVVLRLEHLFESCSNFSIAEILCSK